MVEVQIVPVNSSLINHEVKNCSICLNVQSIQNLTGEFGVCYRTAGFALKEDHTQKENKNLSLPGVTHHLQVADLAFFP